MTGALRVVCSARLAKTAVAELGGLEPNDIERVWHGLAPPYAELFAWVEGAGRGRTMPIRRRSTRRCSPMRWKRASSIIWCRPISTRNGNGTASVCRRRRGRDTAGRTVARLHSRSGEDISGTFPDLIEILQHQELGAFAIDGELLVRGAAGVGSFNELQQRLNRKKVTTPTGREYPAHVRAYDLLAENGEDLRTLPFEDRRLRLQAFVSRFGSDRLDLSPLVPLATGRRFAAARLDPAAAGAGADARAVEGLMLKRRDSPYLPGRPKACGTNGSAIRTRSMRLLMYAQRGHGKRSSFYSDFTFGVWQGEGEAAQLVPVGKAYFGFTDAELAELDRYVRNPHAHRFGPVREVDYGRDRGLGCWKIAFEASAARPATNPASPCVSRASPASAGQAAADADTLTRSGKAAGGRGLARQAAGLSAHRHCERSEATQVVVRPPRSAYREP